VACKQVDSRGNESATSTEQSATPSAGASTKPSPPGMPLVQIASKDALRISWSPGIPPSGEVIDKYFVGIAVPGSGSWTVSTYAYGLDCTIVGGLTKGQLYYCAVYSHSASGYSTYSPLAYFFIGPAAVGTISTDQLANNIIKLKWTPIGGADFYLIERKEARQSSPGTWGNYSSYIPIANASAIFRWDSVFLETYIDNTLQAGVKYKWRITPYDRYGNTNTSAESAEIVVGGQAILDPDWCEAEEDWDANNNPIIHVSWGNGFVVSPRLLSKYQLTRNSSPSLPGTYIVDVDGTVTQFTDTGTSGLGSISAGTTYYYGVRTKDDLGNVSGWEISNAVIPRNPSPPPPPTNLVAYAQGNSIVVTWTQPPEADACILYRSTDGSSYSVQHAGVSTTLSSAASAGARSITVASYSGLAKGDFIYFDDSGKEEAVCITATVTGNTISVTPLHSAHSSGVAVKKAFSPLNLKYTETGATGTKIYFKAKSINNYLISSFSNIDYAIIGEPSRPTAQAIVVGNDIVVSWTKSVPGIEANTIAHYHFYWRVSGGTWSSANQVSGTSANLSTYTTVQQNTTYEFKVEAEDSAGLVSEASPIVTCGIFKPNPPTNLVAFAQQESGVWYIFVQWSAPEQTTNSISYYKLYRKPEGGNYSQVGGNISSTVYKDAFSGLTAGTRYYYYIVAYDTQGLYSDNSNIDSAVVGEPEKPTNVRAVMGDGQATVYWSASTPGSAPLDHYHVWMSSDGSSFSKVGDNLNADPNIGAVVTSYTKTGLSNGANYWFKVSVIDKAGIESEYSETVQTRPYLLPNPPRNVRATAGHLEIHLTWDTPEE
jgi:fibronectin type 3 domain-containing protein